MAAKADKTRKNSGTLPMTNTEDMTPSSNITYNNEVVAIIAGLAANEVEGIAGMCTVSGSLMSKNRTVTKGVKVEVGTEEVAVDLYVIVEYGIPIQRAAADAQENVRKAIESMTGLHVVRVDVHVQSVSFEQEKKALQAGAQNAALAAGETEPEPEQPVKAEPEKPAKKASEKPVKAEPEKKPAEKSPAKKSAAAPKEKAEEPVKKEEPKEETKKETAAETENKPRKTAKKAEPEAAAEEKKTEEKKPEEGPAAPET